MGGQLEHHLARAVVLLAEHGIPWDGPTTFRPSPPPADQIGPSVTNAEPWCRIDFPTEPPTFELYSGKSVYGIRPASEASVRAYHVKPQALASGEVLVDDAEFDAGEADDWSPDDEDDLPHERAAAPIDHIGENAGRG